MVEITKTPPSTEGDEEEMSVHRTSSPSSENVPCPLMPPSTKDDDLQSTTSVTVLTERSSSRAEAVPQGGEDSAPPADSPTRTASDSPPQDMPSEELPDKSNASVVPHSDDEANGSTIDMDDGSRQDADADPSVFLKIEVWLSQFTTEERSIIPKVIQLPLLPQRRWGPQVGRTVYCVLTSLRPEAASYVAAHSILRVFLVGMLAAANPQTTYGCTVIESSLAAICFIHGIAVLTLRIFRVSVLTVLQGLQSFVLGLVAIIPYMGGDIEDIGTGLTYTMIALIVVEIACSIVVLGLEMWLEKRSHKQTSTMDNLQNIAID
eukprot:TRINITY_DN3798_c0_g1_i9.p1 TRINITY_DN3798_c0_g1~~TRINITY_DN3798_c0_g1_i9.p1  ORF type:complete len:320 (+),score=34.04 TRINITY_DN3798_c0_g1_i9:179-1138(+)